VTKTQRLMLESFGFSEDDLKEYVIGGFSDQPVCA